MNFRALILFLAVFVISIYSVAALHRAEAVAAYGRQSVDRLSEYAFELDERYDQSIKAPVCIILIPALLWILHPKLYISINKMIGWLYSMLIVMYIAYNDFGRIEYIFYTVEPLRYSRHSAKGDNSLEKRVLPICEGKLGLINIFVSYLLIGYFSAQLMAIYSEVIPGLAFLPIHYAVLPSILAPYYVSHLRSSPIFTQTLDYGGMTPNEAMQEIQQRTNIYLLAAPAILSFLCCILSYSIDYLNNKLVFVLSLVFMFGLYSIDAFSGLFKVLGGIAASIVAGRIIAKYYSV